MSRQMKELKYYICVFKKDGHTTWRVMLESNMEAMEKQLGLFKATKKKFFEVDRITGNMEEF